MERGKLPEIPVPAWPQTATARLTNHPLSNREFLEVPIRFPGRTGIKIGLGPVACGSIGAPIGQERLDIYGEVINDAAKLRGYDLIVTPALFGQLTPDLAARFEDRGGALVLA